MEDGAVLVSGGDHQSLQPACADPRVVHGHLRLACETVRHARCRGGRHPDWGGAAIRDRWGGCVVPT